MAGNTDTAEMCLVVHNNLEAAQDRVHRAREELRKAEKDLATAEWCFDAINSFVKQQGGHEDG